MERLFLTLVVVGLSPQYTVIHNHFSSMKATRLVCCYLWDHMTHYLQIFEWQLDFLMPVNPVASTSFSTKWLFIQMLCQNRLVWYCTFIMLLFLEKLCRVERASFGKANKAYTKPVTIPRQLFVSNPKTNIYLHSSQSNN